MTDKLREIILKNIRNEFIRASSLHPKMNSYHEGYATILEELDELWDDVKASKGEKTSHELKMNMLSEATQIGAMAVRYIYDLMDELFYNHTSLSNKSNIAFPNTLIHYQLEEFDNQGYIIIKKENSTLFCNQNVNNNYKLIKFNSDVTCEDCLEKMKEHLLL